MLACSFSIESSSKLLVTRRGIKALSSSILGRIRRPILELLALEWQKFHTFELEYLWSQLANLDQILCVASLGWGKGHIRFWGRLTLAHWTQVSDRCPLGYLLVGSFVYFHTSRVRTAKALVRLCGCAGSPEHSPVAHAISTIISWAGSFYFSTVCHDVSNVWKCGKADSFHPV